MNNIHLFFKKLSVHKFASYLTFVIMIVLYIFSAWSFYTISKTEQLSFILFANKEQYSDFFNIFDIPIKLAAAASGVFAAWLTLTRIGQMERQLAATNDNNLFTNYYRHLDEFVKYLSTDPLVNSLEESQKIDPRTILTPLYKLYYSVTYNKFTPFMNDSMRSYIVRLHSFISDSVLIHTNCDFNSITIEQITPPFALVDEPLLSLIEKNYIDLYNHVESNAFAALSLEAARQEREKFRRITQLYASYIFYAIVLSFDGSPYGINENFQNNYEAYSRSLGLVKDQPTFVGISY